MTVLFHACETDCPTGMSNSSFQSLSGAKLALVTVKFAIKPVCHVCSTDNVAAAAAA
ncbi:chitinase [Mycobacterium sp. 1081908.1]|nr:chitinase [Mycobacterium sp. 1081908.1]